MSTTNIKKIQLVKELSQGPIYPIPPAFKKKRIDSDEVIKYVNYLYDHGAKIVLTTAGTSRFNFLTNGELRQLNFAISCFPGKVIVGLQPLANIYLKQELTALAAVKADAVLLFYPDRYYDDETIVNYFHEAADVSPLPVLIHGMFMRHALGGMYNYQPDLVTKLMDHPNILGVKEESTTYALAYKISTLASPSFLVFPAGGSCRRYLLTGPAGAQTFLGGIGNIFPEIEETFFKEFKSGDKNIAYKIVTNYEEVLFKVFSKIGWHKALQEALNYKGLLATENRAPFSAMVDEEQKQIIHNVLDSIQQKWAS
jgi:4-hydroxy-tetrahydrodipicolinate synthase